MQATYVTSDAGNPCAGFTGHYSSRSLRCPRRAIALGLIICTLGASKVMATGESTPLNDEQLDKTFNVLNLVKSMLAECLIELDENGEPVMGPDGEPVPRKLEDVFDNFEQTDPDDPDSDCDVVYEDVDGEPPTLEDAINELFDMVDSERIRSGTPAGGARAVTCIECGTKSDDIIIDSALMNTICDNSEGRRVRAQLELAFVLMNEMVHVYQKFDGTDKRNCDAERDSDDASLKILDALYDAMHDENGDPYDDVADIESEVLKAYLQREELTGGIALTNTADDVADFRKKINDRKAKIFEEALTEGTSWGEAYYKRSWNPEKDPFELPSFILPDREAVELESPDGTQTRTYPMPPGWRAINTAGEPDIDTGRGMLIVAAGEPGGGRALHFWEDVDGDGLPELPEVIPPVALPASAPGETALYDVAIYRGFPSELLVDGGTHALMFLDAFTGALSVLELGPGNLPAGAPRLLFQDAALSNDGGFGFLAGVTQPDPTFVRFSFSPNPEVALLGGSPAVWFDVPIDGGPAIGNVAPGLTIAGALAPFDVPGVEVLSPDVAPLLYLNGNPGETIELLGVGHGFMELLASAEAADNGRTPPIPSASPILGNQLYRIQSSTGGRFQFLPRLGSNIACSVNDEDGDGAGDRIHLSVNPARLHVLAGLPGLPPGDFSMQYAHEQSLAESDPRGITTWNDEQGRMLLAELGPVEVTLIPGSSPAVYTQSVDDLNLDGDLDEAIAVVRPLAAARFTLRVYDQLGLPPAVQTQALQLPETLEPGHYQLTDLNEDGAADVLLTDFATREQTRAINDGFGVFILAGSGDADGDNDVDSADVSRFFDCLSGPESPPAPSPPTTPQACAAAFDIEQDGDVDARDLATVQRLFMPDASE